MLSVRFHGRGGQGAVTAAEPLAAAAFSEGLLAGLTGRGSMLVNSTARIAAHRRGGN